MSDDGIELERTNLFSGGERVFCRWKDLVIKSCTDALRIEKKKDKKVVAILSYQKDDNIHVLETAVDLILKQGGNKMSSLLGE
jgi:hypothetical protein